MFFSFNDSKVTVVSDSSERQILAHGGEMMIVYWNFSKGGVIPLHHHQHEQCTYIISGIFEIIIDEKKEILKVGDSFYVSSNRPHEGICLEAGTLIDIFTPQRDDLNV